jgi:MFS family permease
VPLKPLENNTSKGNINVMNNNKSNQASAVLFRDRNFRWLLSGAIASMLGDQFTLIALPWLVLKMTNDPFVLGTVLALIGVPRAIFILIGGALVDRHSPKRVLMLTKYINTVLLGLLSVLVLTGDLRLWMVYCMAAALGISSAFSIPSGTAILPHVVTPGQLPLANSMMQGIRQLTMFAGPILAGLLIAFSGNSTSYDAANMRGVGIAFLLDAFSFALSAWTLAQVAMRPDTARDNPGKHAHVFKAVYEGLHFCWNDKNLRTLFLYVAAVALFIIGPLHVAIPVLATQLGSAAAFGVLMGAHGAGTLIGMIISGTKPNWRAGNLGSTILLLDCLAGALFIPMGYINLTWQGAALLLLIGTLGGFVQLIAFTWIQQRVPLPMMGRAMGLFMFIFMGITPISAAITGWLMRSITLGQLFVICGSLLIAIVLVAFTTSSMRTIAEIRPVPAPDLEMK